MDDQPSPRKRKSPVKGPTSNDVALAAGVSQSTVSRVFNNRASEFISPDTRRRVLLTAREMGYSPNRMARALRGESTFLIGLIVREVADPFFASLVSILSSQARQMGYEIVLSYANSDPDEAVIITSVLDTRHCDGVILLGDLKNDEIAIQKILASNSNVVALCRGQATSPIPTINSDNQAGLLLLFDHLLSLGHHRLAFIDGGWLGDIRERRDIFNALVLEYGDSISHSYVEAGDNNAEGGYQAMQRLLQKSPRPTAVLASDDVMAIGVLKAAYDNGLRVPTDVSITGFDGIDLARFVSPALTTVRQPIAEMCSRAYRLLFPQQEDQAELIPGPVLLKPELIVQQSTGPAPSDE